MSIILALDEEFFALPGTFHIADFMIGLMNRKPERKGPMRHHSYANAGNPHFSRFREQYAGRNPRVQGWL